MTEQEKQQLSRDVANKYGLDAYRYIVTSFNEDLQPNLTETWLHEDSARCFDLMVEHDVVLVNVNSDLFHGIFSALPNYPKTTKAFQFSDFSNKKEATRIAILKALLAKGE